MLTNNIRSEFLRRGVVDRTLAAMVVGGSGGTIRRVFGDKAAFSGVMGGNGTLNGIFSATVDVTSLLGLETLFGTILGRTDNKDLDEKENLKLRNYEQVLASVLSGATAKLYGGTITQGLAMNAIGNTTFVMVNNIFKYLEDKSEFLQKNFHGKIKNITVYSLTGALSCMTCVPLLNIKTGLSLKQEISIAAVRGLIRGAISKEQDQREQKFKDRNNKSNSVST